MIEFWTLRWFDYGTDEPSDFVYPQDENPESDDEGLLVYLSKEAADAAAIYQSMLWGKDQTGEQYAKAVPLSSVLPVTAENTPGSRRWQLMNAHYMCDACVERFEESRLNLSQDLTVRDGMVLCDACDEAASLLSGVSSGVSLASVILAGEPNV